MDNPHPSAPRETTPPSPPSTDEQEPMVFCPVCDLRLKPRKCKLFCERCGYYMSCADYY
jgi:hypothetical protein